MSTENFTVTVNDASETIIVEEPPEAQPVTTTTKIKEKGGSADAVVNP
jgi:hypothetical protein